MKFTVIDVMRDMGIKDPDKGLTWTVGDMVKNKWFEIHGQLPEKQLRPKTNGPGSHCFAVYPPAFQPEIKRIIQRQLNFRKG